MGETTDYERNFLITQVDLTIGFWLGDPEGVPMGEKITRPAQRKTRTKSAAHSSANALPPRNGDIAAGACTLEPEADLQVQKAYL